MVKELSRLKRIHLENSAFERNTPYNFCDRWCERCEQTTRERCRIYHDEFDLHLQYIADGKNPADPEVAWEMIRTSLSRAQSSLEVLSGGDIPPQVGDEDQFAEDRKKEEMLKAHPLFQAAFEYAVQAHAFLAARFESDALLRNQLIDDYEVVVWYQSLLPVKIHRFLSDLLVKSCPQDAREEVISYRLCDAVGQMNIAMKAVAASKKSLQRLYVARDGNRKVVSDLIGVLERIEGHIQTILQDIDQGRL